MTYIKINDKYYEETITRNEIDLTELEGELLELQQLQPPSDQELIDMGRSMHPYYMERDVRINDLETKISKLKALR